MPLDVTAHLARIGLAATDIPPTLEGLRRLQWAQMTTLPFENIDPLTGALPGLTDDALTDKLLGGGRGGYCLELNGLMARTLPALGFVSRPVLARVRNGGPGGAWRSHYAHLVTLDGRDWLVDTGFGGNTPQAPLDLSDPGEQTLRDATYRWRQEDESGEVVVERRESDGSWFALYGFDRVPVLPSDLDAVNLVCTHRAHPLFPHHLLMAIALPGGRLTLLDRAYRRTQGATREQGQLETVAELADLLRGPFRLTLDDAHVDRIWARVLAAPPLSR
jgi:N-hydroxyarylamine O-acetyltransferase